MEGALRSIESLVVPAVAVLYSLGAQGNTHGAADDARDGLPGLHGELAALPLEGPIEKQSAEDDEGEGESGDPGHHGLEEDRGDVGMGQVEK